MPRNLSNLQVIGWLLLNEEQKKDESRWINLNNMKFPQVFLTEMSF